MNYLDCMVNFIHFMQLFPELCGLNDAEKRLRQREVPDSSRRCPLAAWRATHRCHNRPQMEATLRAALCAGAWLERRGYAARGEHDKFVLSQAIPEQARWCATQVGAC
jgi:hypothetical protein